MINDTIKNHLNPKRMNVEGRFKIINIISDVNMILPKELKLNINQIGILTVMWTHLDEDDTAIISNETIALKTNLSLRTVKTQVKLLVELGWIKIVKRRYNNSSIRQVVIPKEVLTLIENDLNNESVNEGESAGFALLLTNESANFARESANFARESANFARESATFSPLTEQINRTDKQNSITEHSNSTEYEQNNIANAHLENGDSNGHLTENGANAPKKQKENTNITIPPINKKIEEVYYQLNQNYTIEELNRYYRQWQRDPYEADIPTKVYEIFYEIN